MTSPSEKEECKNLEKRVITPEEAAKLIRDVDKQVSYQLIDALFKRARGKDTSDFQIVKTTFPDGLVSYGAEEVKNSKLEGVQPYAKALAPTDLENAFKNYAKLVSSIEQIKNPQFTKKLQEISGFAIDELIWQISSSMGIQKSVSLIESYIYKKTGLTIDEQHKIIFAPLNERSEATQERAMIAALNVARDRSHAANYSEVSCDMNVSFKDLHTKLLKNEADRAKQKALLEAEIAMQIALEQARSAGSSKEITYTDPVHEAVIKEIHIFQQQKSYYQYSEHGEPLHPLDGETARKILTQFEGKPLIGGDFGNKKDEYHSTYIVPNVGKVISDNIVRN
jgi:hypothetical protein